MDYNRKKFFSHLQQFQWKPYYVVGQRGQGGIALKLHKVQLYPSQSSLHTHRFISVFPDGQFEALEDEVDEGRGGGLQGVPGMSASTVGTSEMVEATDVLLGG